MIFIKNEGFDFYVGWPSDVTLYVEYLEFFCFRYPVEESDF